MPYLGGERKSFTTEFMKRFGNSPPTDLKHQYNLANQNDKFAIQIRIKLNIYQILYI